MKPSSSTLHLMRQSVGAVVAAAALSGSGAKAHTSPMPDFVTADAEKKEDPKKEKEPQKDEPKKEEPKKEHVDPCPPCGMG